MRYLSLLICLLAGLSLHAQRENKSSNGWEISASFAPELSKRPLLNGVQFETDPNDIPVSQRPQNGVYDTINIAGQDRIFSGDYVYGQKSSPADSDFWFGATITAHRRIGTNFDFSAGMFFNQAGYTTGVDDEIIQGGIVNTSAPILFNLEEVELRSVGLTLRGNYHLLPERRLHPYFGMGINVYHTHRNQRPFGRAYIGETVEILPLSTPVPDLTNSQINLDFVATAGLLFRISDAWSVGLNVTSTPVLGPGLVGMQIRREL
ncbi:hypothetical protein FUA23_08270 [Neolewinella aurantiaca]|uniref:Outer membrane protein beta-barrel domain-containing protein n=1 Tax=Neolewinella aurantiaca TaxID=2602767 RepID=A0A5C7FJC7_9BACT|nr:hypothetical protein [Neolewinella aurantiaca]TXF89943.1 hypothetical protein FUA23_08270 [Neolewinella aurantiaca]